jgi:hypothetical protein
MYRYVPRKARYVWTFMEQNQAVRRTGIRSINK